jgi:hypothetical protein
VTEAGNVEDIEAKTGMKALQSAADVKEVQIGDSVNDVIEKMKMLSLKLLETLIHLAEKRNLDRHQKISKLKKIIFFH